MLVVITFSKLFREPKSKQKIKNQLEERLFHVGFVRNLLSITAASELTTKYAQITPVSTKQTMWNTKVALFH